MPEAPRISIRELRGYIADAGELTKGTQVADGGLLVNLARHENRLFGEAKGSGQSPYRVSLTFAEQAGGLTARCSCMAARSRPFCKHSAALLVSWARSPESFVVSEAPPAAAEGPAKKKSVKSGKASGADLMKHGVERVTTLVRELAVAGIAAAGSDRVDQVRQLGEALRENRLRRLSARTLELANLIEVATARRGQVDAVAYADLLSDMLLTARRLEKHLAGQTLEPRYVEELVGKSWHKDDRTPVDALDLLEYAFAARVTADDFVIRESRFVDLRTGVHYSEKQILPAFLARRSEPKRSYAATVLNAARGGIYPGFPPHRLDLDVPQPVAVTPAHIAALLERAHPTVTAALAAFQEHRKDVFAPDAYPVSVRTELIVAEDGRFRAADAAGEALHLLNEPRLEEAMTAALRHGRVQAIVGDMTLDGILATLTPMAFVLETSNGLELTTINLAAGERKGRQIPVASDGPPAWLEQARNAGVSTAAVALGEVRLEMADALVTGLSSLVARVTEPLAARLADLGLDKPAAVLAELPGKPDPAERLEGFVKVHQIAGLALVRMAGATTIDASILERLPTAESIAIRRPPNVLRPDELLVARLEGRLTRLEAMWHRAKQLEAMQVDELLTEWPRTWSDGEAAPFVAQRLASAGERAVEVAASVLNDRSAGTTAKLTALRVLSAVGSAPALAAVRMASSEKRVAPIVRARAEKVGGTTKGWFSSLLPGSNKTYDVEDAIRRLTTGSDKDTRLAVLEELERSPREEMITAVRQAWNSDPVTDVRVRAASTLGLLGDSDSVETLVAALRARAMAVREAKGALSGLGALGDVRAVPEMLQALTENWAGSLPSDALQMLGVAALEPVIALTLARPDLAQRRSLQSVVEHAAWSPQALRLMTKYLDETLAIPGGAEKAHALLRLTGESEALREAVAQRILARFTVPADKAEKALVRAAQQALKKNDAAAGADGSVTTGTAG